LEQRKEVVEWKLEGGEKREEGGGKEKGTYINH
jgi:hypothetical protein